MAIPGTADTAADPTAAPPPLGRVLVADDDDALRGLIAAALRREGFDVVEATTGVECVGYAQPWTFRGNPVEPPDIIVSDVRMPGWSGFEALRILRAGSSPPPMILMTAFASPDAHDLAAQLGAAHLFDKPFEIDDLVSVVRELLTLSRLPREAR
jgi:CheY-like chemotaxis protein